VIRYGLIAIISLLLCIPAFAYEETDWDLYEREIRRSKSASLLRLGFAGGTIRMQDSELNRYYEEGTGVFLDFFFYRYRHRNIEEQTSGFDFYTRLTYRKFTLDGDDIGETDIDLLSLDLGARYLMGIMLGREFCQFYVLAAPRVLHYREDVQDEENSMYSLGVIGGIGVEITLAQAFALFVEYNQGYTPVGSTDANVEGIQIYFGLTMRTPL
jgi:hypothetical protein